MSLLDAEGLPLDPLDRSEAEMARRLNEALFGLDPERRVRELRRSILGDEAPVEQLVGLAAALEGKNA